MAAKIGQNSLNFCSEKIRSKVQSIAKKHSFFHWDLEFLDVFYDEDGKRKENSGFDGVVGNPPYIKEFSHKQIFVDLKKSKVKNSVYYQGKMDYWYIFSCVSIDLLKENGYHGFIATNNWITNFGASILRNKILKESKIIKFIDFVDYKIFKGIGNQAIGQQTMIYFLEKNSFGDYFEVNYIRLNDPKCPDIVVRDYIMKQIPDSKIIEYAAIVKREQNNKIYFLEPQIHKLKEKILRQKNIFLNENEIAQGIVTPQDRVIQSHLPILNNNFKKGDGVFVINDTELKSMNCNSMELSLIKPLFTTKELLQYTKHKKNNLWIIYTNTKTIKQMRKFPNIKKHLNNFTKIITSDSKPYGLHRARNERFFIGEKILSLRKTSIPKFSYVNFPSYVLQTYMIIKTKKINQKYLTALLNSKIAHFFFYYEKRQGGNLQIDKEPLLNFPIKKADAEIEKKVISLANSLNLRTVGGEVRNKEIVVELDNIFFKLYGLNKNEIKSILTI